MGLDEVRAVRPQGGLPVAPEGLLVLNEERQDRVAVDDDEARTLAVHVSKRDVFRDPGHQNLVRFVDVRREPRLHPASHRREKGLVDPGAVRALKALRSREGEDHRFRDDDEQMQVSVNLSSAYDYLAA